MQHHRKLLVTAHWDDEAGVWVATSEDIPGLVTEAKNIDDLVRRVRELIPDLLEENAHLIAHGQDVADLLELCVTSQFSLPGNHAH